MPQAKGLAPHRVPANVKFEIDDCEQPWTFQEKFDYVHARYLAAAIVDWPKLMEQAFTFTKPGGYAEFQDFDLTYRSEDGSMTPDRTALKWANELLKASRDFGHDPCPGAKLKGWMKDAGFENVVAQKYRIPIGPWAKDKHLVGVPGINVRGRGKKLTDGVEEHRQLEPGPARRRSRGLYAPPVHAVPGLEAGGSPYSTGEREEGSEGSEAAYALRIVSGSLPATTLLYAQRWAFGANHGLRE